MAITDPRPQSTSSSAIALYGAQRAKILPITLHSRSCSSQTSPAVPVPLCPCPTCPVSCRVSNRHPTLGGNRSRSTSHSVPLFESSSQILNFFVSGSLGENHALSATQSDHHRRPASGNLLLTITPRGATVQVVALYALEENKFMVYIHIVQGSSTCSSTLAPLTI